MQGGKSVAGPVRLGLVGAGQHGIRYTRHIVRMWLRLAELP